MKIICSEKYNSETQPQVKRARKKKEAHRKEEGDPRE